MATFSPQEVFMIEGDDQTDVTLAHPYVVGTSELLVFLNGFLIVQDEDYTEVDEYTVRFTDGLSADDVVVIRHQVYFDDKLVSIIGRPKNSLFQTKGTVATLMPNQSYKLKFSYDQQHLSISFDTVLTPLYSNVQLLKNDLGDISEDLQDKRLLLLIYENSILAENIASAENKALLASEAKTPYVYKQFVRYRTELDIMTAVYMSLTGRNGSEKRVLGQFNVERRRELGMVNIDVILKDLRAKLQEWERTLRGSSTLASPLATAVRGGTSKPYPLTTPRTG